jgi:hypothetical protein
MASEPGLREREPAQPAAARWLDRWGTAAAFVWGFAEATLFFIAPDVFGGAVARLAPRRAVRAAAAAVAGAVVASVVLFGWASASGQTARAVIGAVPAVHPWMFTEAARSLADQGGVVMIASAFTGIPYKVWAFEMVVESWTLLSLMAWTIPARALRLGLVAGGAGLVGWFGRRRIVVGPWLVLGVWLAIWVAIYVEYWTRVGL